jgi:glycosyltransferase involved in cell wall biosynthesis
MKIGVCIPFYNEEKWISATLEALLAQKDAKFTVFLCDNNSTDASVEICRSFIQAHKLDWQVVSETQKGTGAAADTAMRAAAAAGCDILARTDADSLPDENWIKSIRAEFARRPQLSMISGLSIPIRSEVSFFEFWLLRFATTVAMLFGLVRPSNYQRGMRGPYIMTSGNNLAIRATAYLMVGGFPRTRIEDVHEDRALVNAARSRGLRVRRHRKMRVAVSARRVQHWGLMASIRWYRSHYRPSQNVDIR